MALKVKAKEQYQNIGKYAGKYRYVMMPELYTALTRAATTLAAARTRTTTSGAARTRTSNFSSRFSDLKLQSVALQSHARQCKTKKVVFCFALSSVRLQRHALQL